TILHIMPAMHGSNPPTIISTAKTLALNPPGTDPLLAGDKSTTPATAARHRPLPPRKNARVPGSSERFLRVARVRFRPTAEQIIPRVIAPAHTIAREVIRHARAGASTSRPTCENHSPALASFQSRTSPKVNMGTS